MGEQVITITMKDGNVIKIGEIYNMTLHHWMRNFNNGISVEDTIINYSEYIAEDGCISEKKLSIILSENNVESIVKEDAVVNF